MAKENVFNQNSFVYKKKLPNGLKVLVHEMPWAQSVSIRLLISAGPRWEDSKTNGIAHFLEHMLLEGSQKYPSARELGKTISNLGGTYSAYTNKEYVMYQIKVPTKYASSATEIIREFVFNPIMDKAAVLKEKGIIKSELKRSNDDPNSHSWDLIREFAWKGHILGEKTLGTFNSIKRINRNDLVKYHQNFYCSNNAILVIAGNIDKEKALKLVSENFGDLKPQLKLKLTNTLPKFNKEKSKIFIENKKLEETHFFIVFSTKGKGENSQELPKIQILSQLLGREIFYKLVYGLGISYSAFSYPYLVLNDGLLVVGAGVHPEKTEEAINIMIDEISNLKITKESFFEAKESLKGNLTLDIADTDEYAHFIGEQELYTGKIKSPEEIRSIIDGITLESINKLRKTIITNKNSALIVLGPISKNKLKKFQTHLLY